MDRQGDMVYNCNSTKLWLLPTLIPRTPNSLVFCQTVKNMCFAHLCVWRNSTGLVGWRNTHFVTCKSLPPLSPWLATWGFGVSDRIPWDTILANAFWAISYTITCHYSSTDPSMVLMSFVNHLPWTRAEGQGITYNRSVVFLNSGNPYFADYQKKKISH